MKEERGAMRRFFRSLFRHVFGYLVFLPTFVILIIFQALVVKPIFKNQTTIPYLIYRSCGRFFGIRFEFNKNCAPVADDKITLFTANHLARFDFIMLDMFPNSAVMMDAKILKIPVWGTIIKLFTSSSGFVATQQNTAHKVGDLTQLGHAAQEGRNIFVFPEGIQSDGRRVLRFSQGSAEIFYDADLLAKYPALQTAQLQPVVLRVKTIDGEYMLDQPAKWEPYTLTHQLTNPIAALSCLSMVRSIVVDTLICAPLDPRDFDSAADLINAAHAVTSAIIAPEQTETLTRRQWVERVAAKDFAL